MVSVKFSLISKEAWDAFSAEFSDMPSVACHKEPFDKISADCIASTCNSFGRMDGGIDGSINALVTSFEPNQSYFHERSESHQA